MTEFLKLIGIGILAVFILLLLVQIFQKQKQFIEGLTNAEPTSAPTNGEAGKAATYASAIKANVVKLQDELLISKYRKDYENILINMDDYLNMLSLKTVLNIKQDDIDPKQNIEVIQSLNILKNAKDSLNATMKYLDTQ